MRDENNILISLTEYKKARNAEGFAFRVNIQAILLKLRINAKKIQKCGLDDFLIKLRCL
jgi:hypothetical protein